MTWQAQLTAWLLGPGLQTAVVIILAIGIRVLVVRVIRHVVNRAVARARSPRISPAEGAQLDVAASQVAGERIQQRAAAIGTLLASTATIVIAVTAVLTILPILGIAITPLLASAGVIGVALGFGAQTLIKDYVAGIFLILEDQYGVGDVVDVGSVTATVELVALRFTRLRDPSGVIWYVRNGEILRVANHSQGWVSVDVVVDVADDTQPDALARAIADLSEKMSAEGAREGLLTAPVLAGTASAGEGWSSARIHAAVSPDRRDEAVRVIDDQARQVLNQAGITVRPPAADR